MKVVYSFPPGTEYRKERREIFLAAIEEWRTQTIPLETILANMKIQITQLESKKPTIVAPTKKRIALFDFFNEIVRDESLIVLAPDSPKAEDIKNKLTAWLEFLANEAKQKSDASAYGKALKEIGIVENDDFKARTVSIKAARTDTTAKECLPAELVIDTQQNLDKVALLESIGILAIADRVLKYETPAQVVEHTEAMKAELLRTVDVSSLVKSWLDPTEKTPLVDIFNQYAKIPEAKFGENFFGNQSLYQLQLWIDSLATTATRKKEPYITALRSIGIIEPDLDSKAARTVRIIDEDDTCLPAEFRLDKEGYVRREDFLESIGILMIADRVLKLKNLDEVPRKTKELKTELSESESSVEEIIERWKAPSSPKESPRVQQSEDDGDETEELEQPESEATLLPGYTIAKLQSIFNSETQDESNDLHRLYGWNYPRKWTGPVSPWAASDDQPKKFGIMQLLYFVFDDKASTYSQFGKEKFDFQQYGLTQNSLFQFEIKDYAKWNNMVVGPLNEILEGKGNLNEFSLGEKRLFVFRTLAISIKMVDPSTGEVLAWGKPKLSSTRLYNQAKAKCWAISLFALLRVLIIDHLNPKDTEQPGKFMNPSNQFYAAILKDLEIWKNKFENIQTPFPQSLSQIAQAASILECIETHPEYVNNPGRIASELYEPIQDHLESNGVPDELAAAVVHLGLTDPLFHKVSLNVDMKDTTNQTRYLHTLSVLASMLDKNEYPQSEIDRCFSEWPY